MMRNLLLLFLLCVTSLLYAQDPLAKFKLNDTLNSLYPVMTFKMACRYSAKKQNDSCFFFLNEFSKAMNKFHERKGCLIMILTSPELNANLVDKRWNAMRESMIKELKTYYGPEFNASLFIKLETYETEDQNARWAALSSKNKIKNKVGFIDTLNLKHLKFVDSLLEHHVVLNKKTIGEGMESVLLFIQHCEDTIRQRKYAGQIKDWFVSGDLSGSSYALFLDRIRINQNKSQIYGTQFWRDEKASQLVLYPIESIAEVNKLRKQMGMKSIQYYLLNVEFLEKKKFRRESVAGLLKGNESLSEYIDKEMDK